MLSRVVASTKPVLASGRTVSQPAPMQYRTDPQDPPSCVSWRSAPQSAVLPVARPSARWDGDCGDAAMRSERSTDGSPAATERAGRLVMPRITARPALPPGSSGSASRARAASSSAFAPMLRSGRFVPA